MQVLDRIFGSLQRAEVGDLQEGEPDAALPQRVKVTQSGAQPHSSSLAKRRPFGLVESLFGLDVQVQHMLPNLEHPAISHMSIFLKPLKHLRLPDCFCYVSISALTKICCS